jgi:MraZ protein
VKTFSGEYERTVDSKGRVVLPPAIRKLITDGGYISQGEDGCLALWTQEEFESQASKRLEQEANGSREIRMKNRFWAASAFAIELDNQGRIQLQVRHRTYATIELNKEVVVLGVMNRAEIWNAERLYEYRNQLENEENDESNYA